MVFSPSGHLPCLPYPWETRAKHRDIAYFYLKLKLNLNVHVRVLEQIRVHVSIERVVLLTILVIVYTKFSPMCVKDI